MIFFFIQVIQNGRLDYCIFLNLTRSVPVDYIYPASMSPMFITHHTSPLMGKLGISKRSSPNLHVLNLWILLFFHNKQTVKPQIESIFGKQQLIHVGLLKPVESDESRIEEENLNTWNLWQQIGNVLWEFCQSWGRGSFPFHSWPYLLKRRTNG